MDQSASSFSIDGWTPTDAARMVWSSVAVLGGEPQRAEGSGCLRHVLIVSLYTKQI